MRAILNLFDVRTQGYSSDSCALSMCDCTWMRFQVLLSLHNDQLTPRTSIIWAGSKLGYIKVRNLFARVEVLFEMIRNSATHS